MPNKMFLLSKEKEGKGLFMCGIFVINISRIDTIVSDLKHQLTLNWSKLLNIEQHFKKSQMLADFKTRINNHNWLLKSFYI